MLERQNINNIITKADEEPDFLAIFGETEDSVNDWRNATEMRLQELEFRAFKEVSDRKAVTQTGFKKLSYPSLNGDVLK